MKTIKKTSKKRQVVRYMEENYNIFFNALQALKDKFDDKTEQVYMLFFDSKGTFMGIENISKAAGTVSQVALDMARVEALLTKINGLNMIYGLAHNHPYMTDSKGNWIQTLVSDADVISTKTITTVQADHWPDMQYAGHFVVNKEDDGIDKIIFFNDEIEFKYSEKVLAKVREREL